jgi:carbon storage regulator
MLVISRKTGEELVVPQCELHVKVMHVSGRRVRLGISAPTKVKVLRGELLEDDQSPGEPDRHMAEGKGHR